MPLGRTAASLPDSDDLWKVVWNYKDVIGGIAHTHPWDGKTTASHTDVTTFLAIEKALGKRLLWPIYTMTDSIVYAYGINGYEVIPEAFGKELLKKEDIQKLRDFSTKPNVLVEQPKLQKTVYVIFIDRPNISSEIYDIFFDKKYAEALLNSLKKENQELINDGWIWEIQEWKIDK